MHTAAFALQPRWPLAPFATSLPPPPRRRQSQLPSGSLLAAAGRNLSSWPLPTIRSLAMLIEGCTWPEAPAAKRAESRGREMTEGRPEAHAQGCRAPALVTGLAVAMQDSRSSPLQEPGTSPPRRTVRYRASVERAVGQVIHARTVADARLLGGSRPELTRAMSPEPGGDKRGGAGAGGAAATHERGVQGEGKGHAEELWPPGRNPGQAEATIPQV